MSSLSSSPHLSFKITTSDNSNRKLTNVIEDLKTVNNKVDPSYIVMLEDLFSVTGDRDNVKSYFYANHLPTMFTNLVSSTLVEIGKSLATEDDTASVNFQGSNSTVRYYGLNVLPITDFYKNIPYIKYASPTYWTLLTIEGEKSKWGDNLQYFSICPYLGQYLDSSNNVTYDYLASVNESVNSILLKSNDPSLFKDTKDSDSFSFRRAYVIFTFNKTFQKLMHRPKENRYAFLLPADLIEKGNFVIMSRFIRQNTKIPLNLSLGIKAFCFKELPYFSNPVIHQEVSQRLSHLNDATSQYIYKQLSEAPRLTSNYTNNKENIDSFIAKVKKYNSSTSMTSMKIYPYFYLANKNHVTTNVYQLLESDSTVNALVNDENKNYYQTGIINLRNTDSNENDGDSSLLNIKSIKIVAINHSLSEIATKSTIQVYDVATQKSLQTFSTSTTMPVITSKNYYSSLETSQEALSKSQTEGVFEFTINFENNQTYEGVNQIGIFERVSYPLSFIPTDNTHSSLSTNTSSSSPPFSNTSPRYTSFSYSSSYTTANSSLTDTIEDVERDNIYTIKTNTEEFSLHENYNKYSTLNFRVYSLQ